MKNFKLGWKLKSNVFNAGPTTKFSFFSQAIKLDQIPMPSPAQKHYHPTATVPNIKQQRPQTAPKRPVLQNSLSKPLAARDMFQRIIVRNPELLASKEAIKEIMKITDEKELQIFDLIFKELDLDSMLSPAAIQSQGFPIQYVNLLGMYFGYKFVMKEKLVKKKPVVSIMGHVDHGKTTLLDFYRNSRKAESEVGGITQKIGGFMLETQHGPVSFIDTPGHAVFSNMRRTGAFLADVVVLIVSAVEGVQPQTEEVLSLIQEHNLPFIVALNKIDARGADPEAAEEQLVERGVDLEPYGGSIPVVHISAKTGQNMELLLELLLDVAKDLNLQADVAELPECLVLETAVGGNNELRRSSVVVKNGILEVQKPMVLGNSHFKIMRMTNDLGESITSAQPGDIVEIAGFSIFPKSAERVLGMTNEALSKTFCKLNEDIHRTFFKEYEDMVFSDYKVKFADRWEKHKFYGDNNFFKEKMQTTASELRANIQSKAAEGTNSDEVQKLNKQLDGLSFMLRELEGNKIDNPIMIKVSNMGTLETIKSYLNKIEKKTFTLLDLSCGQITETDLKMCKKMNAKILTFDLPKCNTVSALLKQYEVNCINHNIIYKLFDDIKIINDSVQGKISSNVNIEVLGRGKVKKVFDVKGDKGKKPVKIAGCIVEIGEFNVEQKFRILRKGRVIADNLTLNSLKRFKAEVEVVEQGQDTGLAFVNHSDIIEGDVIEAYD